MIRGKAVIRKILNKGFAERKCVFNLHYSDFLNEGFNINTERIDRVIDAGDVHLNTLLMQKLVNVNFYGKSNPTKKTMEKLTEDMKVYSTGKDPETLNPVTAQEIIVGKILGFFDPEN